MPSIEKIVPDTSVVIEGYLSKKLIAKQLSVERIIIPEAVIAELEHQANESKSTGMLGLDEIRLLKELSDKNGFTLCFSGMRPKPQDIQGANLGEIDAIIRELARAEGATLITADRVQAKVAESKGTPVLLVELEARPKHMELEKYFDKDTMSAHLRENMLPEAKKGRPGAWELVHVAEQPLRREDIQRMAKEIIEAGNQRIDGFVELDRKGSTICQIGEFRIVITRPPFSDAWEITAVRPIVKLSLSDYHLSEKLSSRIDQQAEGMLIAGAPGNGKSTFAQAMAEHFAGKHKIVKTVEAPRDLQLSENITQYAISHGSAEEIHDILLLTRPDYTIFDEMRNTADFLLYSDLRLSGVGMIGIVHATKPVDAIQRFIGRIELGVIPQIVDTVLYIKDGKVSKVFSVEMQVKVPAGMTEADLSRPIVTITDFETNRIEYEIYSYGEETIVVPVSKEDKGGPAKQLAALQIQKEIAKYVSECQVKVVSDNKCVVSVPKHEKKIIIGKAGVTIMAIEKKLGISIDIAELEKSDSRKTLSFRKNIASNHIELMFDKHYENKDIDILVNGELLATVNVGRKAMIRIKKDNHLGKTLANAFQHGDKVEMLG